MKQMLFVGIALYTLLNPAPILSGLSLSFDITYECDTWNEFGVLTVKQFEINPPKIDLNKNIPLTDIGLYTIGLVGKNIALQAQLLTKKDPEKIAFIKKQCEEEKKQLIATTANNEKIKKKIDQENIKQQRLTEKTNHNMIQSRDLLSHIYEKNYKKVNSNDLI